jgi:hypothetical protein
MMGTHGLKDEELRKKRADRFGIEYEEPDLTGLKKEGKAVTLPAGLKRRSTHASLN